MKISKVKELVLANELAIENDSTVDKLNEVLRYCFPDDIQSSGQWRYYFNDFEFGNEWDWKDETNLPTIKVSEIYMESTDSANGVIIFVEMIKNHLN